MIVPMVKLQVLGPRRLLGEVLSFLQQQGVVQLRDAPPRTGPRPAIHPAPVASGEIGALREAMTRIDALLERLPPASREGDGVSLPAPGTPEFLDALASAEAGIHALDERRAALLAERQSLARLSRLLAALAPLRAESPPPPRARAFGVAVRRDRDDAVALLDAEVARLTDGTGLVRSTDAGSEKAVLLLVPESRAARVAALLFEHGVDELKVPPRFEGATPARTLLLLHEREAAIPAEVARVDESHAAAAARLRGALRSARGNALTRLARLEAVATCGETGHAFVVWGWAPRARVASLVSAAAAEFGDRVTIVSYPITRAEAGEVPVMLSNPPWLAPFELLLTLVPLPRYGSTDPTPWMALFFPLFFGIMLGDVGFGVLAVAMSLLARARRWGGDRGGAIAVIALACGASATGFGLLFGEAFGTLGETIGLHPVLLDRRAALLPLLGLALALGLLHLASGLALGAWESARNRRTREAVGHLARLGLLVAASSAAASALDVVPAWAVRPALVAVLACAVLAIASEGFTALLEAVLSLGNVLSYARLAALSLASVMLAEVANGMPAALPGAAGVVLAISLHAVNFTLGIVSPAIAALRLQVVEFFEKFYREGGRAYRPFARA